MKWKLSGSQRLQIPNVFILLVLINNDYCDQLCNSGKQQIRMKCCLIIKNRLARLLSRVQRRLREFEGGGGRMVLKTAPLPEDIIKLGAEGVNQLWRDAKLRGLG
jgi:hypothetical protein